MKCRASKRKGEERPTRVLARPAAAREAVQWWLSTGRGHLEIRALTRLSLPGFVQALVGSRLGDTVRRL